MSNDTTRRDDVNMEVVVITEEWQVRYWSNRFRVRPRDLKRAVRAVGNKPEDVERYIREQIQRALTESGAEGD